jgi:hypothetical protein
MLRTSYSSSLQFSFSIESIAKQGRGLELLKSFEHKHPLASHPVWAAFVMTVYTGLL